MTGKNDTTKDAKDSAGKRGGLPDDPGLDAFGAAAATAFTPRRRTPAPAPVAEPVAEPKPEQEGEAAGPAPAAPPEAPAPQPAAEPQAPAPPPAIRRPQLHVADPGPPAGPVEVRVPDVGDAAHRITQCTVLVRAGTRARFEYYQFKTRFDTGREPSNVIVVKRALNAAKKADRFGELHDQVARRLAEDAGDTGDPDDLFSEAVPGRRADRGRTKTTVQQSFRPSYGELATIDAIWQAYRFPSRSDFLDAVLDDFLPEVPDKPRGRRP